jgi:hypothetical protein
LYDRVDNDFSSLYPEGYTIEVIDRDFNSVWWVFRDEDENVFDNTFVEDPEEVNKIKSAAKAEKILNEDKVNAFEEVKESLT